jgi:hypothetical protein
VTEGEFSDVDKENFKSPNAKPDPIGSKSKGDHMAAF